MSAAPRQVAKGWFTRQDRPVLTRGRWLLTVFKSAEDAEKLFVDSVVTLDGLRLRIVSSEIASPDGDLELTVSALSPDRRDPESDRRGVKYDNDKPRFDLLPHRALHQMTLVLTCGAKKYSAENWRKVPGWRWRYYRAALGHIWAWWGGDKLDQETGLPHLAHAMCCVAFLLELDEAKNPPPPWEGSESPHE
jgi:hypothetical protein